MEFKVIIPSHKRAKDVLTTSAVANACLCVEASQEEEYRKHNPNIEIIVHPDEIVGLTAKRQWIIEKFPSCFQIDDDIKSIQRLYTESGEPTKVDPETAYQLIQQAGNTAKLLGAHIFGFNHVGNPSNYDPLKPFRLTGYVNTGAFGIIEGHKLYFDTRMKVVEDYQLSCVNAYYHRICFLDNRFTVIGKDTFSNPGGCSDYRTEEQEGKDTMMLRKVYGEVVELKKDTGVAKRKHKYQRTLKIPF